MKQINTMRASLLSMLLVAITGLTAYGQLNGTYTVYGASPNYATLQDAVNALTAGVSGPVTFFFSSKPYCHLIVKYFCLVMKQNLTLV